MFFMNKTSADKNTKEVNDKIFGQMEYKNGWRKFESMNFLGTEQTVKVRARAYPGERITEEQRQGYRWFCAHRDEVFKRASELLLDHMNGLDTWRAANIQELAKAVSLRTVLFHREGQVVLLLDCAWDEENGVGVLVHPEYKVGVQDLFLML